MSVLGRWVKRAFPACGCDACDESPEGEALLLQSRIDEVTAGRFQERVRIPDQGPAQLEWEFGSASAGMIQLDREHLLRFAAVAQNHYSKWRSW